LESVIVLIYINTIGEIIDAELLEEAKKRKLNLSQLLEWAIDKALNGEINDFDEGLRPCPEGVRGFKSRPPHV